MSPQMSEVLYPGSESERLQVQGSGFRVGFPVIKALCTAHEGLSRTPAGVSADRELRAELLLFGLFGLFQMPYINPKPKPYTRNPTKP